MRMLKVAAPYLDTYDSRLALGSDRIGLCVIFFGAPWKPTYLHTDSDNVLELPGIVNGHVRIQTDH